METSTYGYGLHRFIAGSENPVLCLQVTSNGCAVLQACTGRRDFDRPHSEEDKQALKSISVHFQRYRQLVHAGRWGLR